MSLWRDWHRGALGQCITSKYKPKPEPGYRAGSRAHLLAALLLHHLVLLFAIGWSICSERFERLDTPFKGRKLGVWNLSRNTALRGYTQPLRARLWPAFSSSSSLSSSLLPYPCTKTPQKRPFTFGHRGVASKDVFFPGCWSASWRFHCIQHTPFFTKLPQTKS